MAKEYYRKNHLNGKHFKYFTILIIVIMIIGLIPIIKNSIETNDLFFLIPIIVIMSIIPISFLFFGKLVDKLKKPIVELKEDKIIIVNSNWIREEIKIPWEKVEGFILIKNNPIFKMPIFNTKRIIRIVTDDDKINKKSYIELDFLENSNDLIKQLKGRVKDLTEKHHSSLLSISSNKKEYRYKGYHLTPEGIIKENQLISWNSIYEIKSKGIVLTGYGGLKIKYRMSGNNGKMNIKAGNDKDYLNVIKYIIKNSCQARVDKKLYNLLEKSPKGAKIEDRILILNIVFPFIMIFTLYIVDSYILESFARVPITFAVYFWPFSISLGILTSRIRKASGNWNNISLHSKLSLSKFLVLFLAIMMFFQISPASLNYIKGDYYNSKEDYKHAYYNYQKVLDKHPENIEVKYSTAKALVDLGDYTKALFLMEDVYENFSGEWNPQAVKLIPEILIKLNRTQEALDWCQRILNDYPDSEGVQEVIFELENSIKS
ncbi:MAG: tetratricopeptide repeat protein [Halanaerobiaceae bacterium]